jgi:hypothetical protein
MRPGLGTRGIQDDARNQYAEKQNHQNVGNPAKPASALQIVPGNEGPVKTEKSTGMGMTGFAVHRNPTAVGAGGGQGRERYGKGGFPLLQTGSLDSARANSNKVLVM